jgi:hypothetical protein
MHDQQERVFLLREPEHGGMQQRAFTQIEG